MKKHLLLALASCLILAAPTLAQDAAKNVLKGGDVESAEEGGFNMNVEDWAPDQFQGPVAPELQMDNSFLNVTTDKARSGKKSIRVALTNETAEKWLKNPAKGPEFTSLYIHYTVSPRRDISAALAAEKIVFRMWVFVEKGDFSAKFLARTSNGVLMKGDVAPTDTGKWVEVKLTGQGKPGIKTANIRLDIECKGEFTAYLDDFYFGPAE